jgi:hypothetical protein
MKRSRFTEKQTIEVDAGREGIVDAVFASGGPLASDWVPTAADRSTIIAALG